MGISNNTTAKKYNTLQKSINWLQTTDNQQLDTMLAMRKLLINTSCTTPIFDNGQINLITGNKLTINASDCLDSLSRRILRLQNV